MKIDGFVYIFKKRLVLNYLFLWLVVDKLKKNFKKILNMFEIVN